MGFLVKLWHVISTLVVVLPKVWPLIKVLAGKGLDLFIKKKVDEKRREELKQAAKVAEETGDTDLLEAKIGAGSVVGDVKQVAPSALATESASSLESVVSTEKKSLLENQEASNSTGSTILSSAVKIAGVGVAFYLLDAMLRKKDAKAASMNVGANSGNVILDAGSGIKNNVIFRGSNRMGSKFIP